MFYVQSCFGLGATIAPFISTAFAQHVPDRAYLYYLVSMGVALVTTLVLVLVFEVRTEEQIVGNMEENTTVESGQVMESVGEKEDSRVEVAMNHESSASDLDIVSQVVVPPTSGMISIPLLVGLPSADQASGPAMVAFTTVSNPPDDAPIDEPSKGSWGKLQRLLGTPSIYVISAFNFLYVRSLSGSLRNLPADIIRSRLESRLDSADG